MSSLAKAIGVPQQELRLRQAYVVSVETTTCTVRFGGSDSADDISGVKRLGYQRPVAGDAVWVLQNGLDLLVLGGVFANTLGDDKLVLWNSASAPHYSLGIQSGTLKYSAPASASHDFYVAGDEIGRFESDGLNTDKWLRQDVSGVGLYNTANTCGIYTTEANITRTYQDEAFRAGNSMLRQYDSSYAQWGHNTLAATGTYQFMARNTGLVLIRATNDGDERVLLGCETASGTWIVDVQTSRTNIANEFRVQQDARITDWSTGHAVFQGVSSFNAAGGNPFGLLCRDTDGRIYLGANSTAGNGVILRVAGSDKYIFSASGAAADVRFIHLGVATANVPVEVSSISGQLFKVSSSGRFKKDIADLPRKRGKDNPVMRLRPRRYHWRDDDPNTPPETRALNQRFPDGIPGFIAEEVAEVAPDCVVWEEEAPVIANAGEGPESLIAEGHVDTREADWAGARPAVISQLPLLAHMVQAFQDLEERLEIIEAAISGTPEMPGGGP